MSEYFLAKGSHRTAGEGRCAMEWVAYIAGEKHSDHPVCVSGVLRKFCMELNDATPSKDRQRLRPYLARCIGTRDDGLDDMRRGLLRASTKPGGLGEMCVACILKDVGFDGALALLDRMLPKVMIDLPAPAAERAREVCRIA